MPHPNVVQILHYVLRTVQQLGEFHFFYLHRKLYTFRLCKPRDSPSFCRFRQDFSSAVRSHGYSSVANTLDHILVEFYTLPTVIAPLSLQDSRDPRPPIRLVDPDVFAAHIERAHIQTVPRRPVSHLLFSRSNSPSTVALDADAAFPPIDPSDDLPSLVDVSSSDSDLDSPLPRLVDSSSDSDFDLPRPSMSRQSEGVRTVPQQQHSSVRFVSRFPVTTNQPASTPSFGVHTLRTDNTEQQFGDIMLDSGAEVSFTKMLKFLRMLFLVKLLFLVQMEQL